jgi:hypothetical protein
MDSVNDELQRRINEHVLNGDAPSIIWAMEGQIRINTKLEVKVAELERREALLTAFVVAEDAWNAHAECSYCWDEDDELYWQMMNARAALDWIAQP